MLALDLRLVTNAPDFNQAAVRVEKVCHNAIIHSTKPIVQAHILYASHVGSS